MNDIEDEMKKLTEDMLARSEQALYAGTCADAEHREPLTLEALQKLGEFMKPLPNLYVVAVEHLPDDCYGILYVRPEDAAKWKAASAQEGR